ncbi:P-loop containing nucleoside triphosphate hydrolase protein [Daedaleopsis nitida]|nr:P-loop containing nucleoside triphosphate hydrolase protein [Daedaleopsis nitida]
MVVILEDVGAEVEARMQEEQQMELALRLSLRDYNASKTRESGHSGTQKARAGSTERDLESLDAEIEDVEQQRRGLDGLLQTLYKQREEKLRQIRSAQAAVPRSDPNGKGKSKAGTIDYNSEFEWSGALLAKLRSVFGFESFRLCQEGICNANMDGRDIVAIMPTGGSLHILILRVLTYHRGGKSLGYQLPALMVPGCSLVISPLLALISDQVMHLHDAKVDAVMLTGATSREESDRIYKRLQAMASGASDAPEIKLCYVTPEKIANSKKFKAALDKLYRVNKLGIPDYQKLSAVRQMFPKVPILALSATCPAAVLADLIKTLRMPALTLASTANHEGTVLFSTSLYRKNLHYVVLPKPAGGSDSMKAMSDYILQHHASDSGIVYCLTKKDAESVAEELTKLSHGKIRTGVYHADVPDQRKEKLHRQWREGQIKVVCATIAFGLGIDKGDVRFVIHHTKSLDGFYQESGRAGRDGADAQCILYYRAQDATRILSLTYGEPLAMLAFASDVQECRTILFANYFNKSSKLSFSSWTTEQEDTLTACGHCDNCTRAPETLERLGVRTRVVAWQILRVLKAAGGGVTMAQLCDLARGLGGSNKAQDASEGRGKGKGRAKEKVSVDVHEVAGGKVELSKEQTEAVCVRLLVEGYIGLTFTPTAYTVNVYLSPAPLGERFTRLERKAIEQGKGPDFDCPFVKKAVKSRKSVGSAAASSSAAGSKKAEKAQDAVAKKGKGKDVATPRGAGAVTGRKRKRALTTADRLGSDAIPSEDEDDKDDGDVGDDDVLFREEMEDFIVFDDEDEDEKDEEREDVSSSGSDMDWQTSLRGRGRGRVAKDPQPPPVGRVQPDAARVRQVERGDVVV